MVRARVRLMGETMRGICVSARWAMCMGMRHRRLRLMGVGMGTERCRGGERVGVVRLRGTISRQEHCYGDEDEKAGEG